MSNKATILWGAAKASAAASILILTTILCVSVFAGQIQGGSSRRVFLFEEFQLDGANNAQSFFLFSRGKIENHEGTLYIFGGDVSISGSFSGEAYTFFGRVELKSGDSRQSAVFHTLSSRVYSSRSGVSVLPVLGGLDFFMNTYSVPKATVYDNTIPGLWLNIFLGLGGFALSFILLPVKKSFFEQSGLSVINEPIRAVRNGIILYFTLLTSAFVFMLSILGFPISVAILLVMVALCLVGQVSVGYSLGFLCLRTLNRDSHRNAYSNVAVGVIMIQAVRLVPFMKWVMDFLILPILALGSIATGIINGFLKKKFYDAEGFVGNSGAETPNEHIREIILGMKSHIGD